MQPSETPSQAAIEANDQTQPVGKLHWVTLSIIVVLGIAARLKCLACKPFWFDECFSVEVARIDWRNFLHLLWWREANMSLYYALLRVWLHFGQSPFFIRSLSAAISAASLLAIYWLAGLLYNRRVALYAAALLAVNAYDVRYAQEARSYALFVLLATLSSGFLVTWLRQPTPRKWRGYIVASVLAVYAHFYALLLLVAHWLVLRWAGKPGSASAESAKAGLKRAWTVIALAVLPLLIFVAKTGAGPIRWIQRPRLSDLLRFTIDLTNGLPILYLAACLLALLPSKRNLFARNQKWDTWRVQFLCIWLLCPITLTILLSFARPVFLPRYMIFCIPALLTLTAAGLASVRPAWLGGLTLMLVFALSARMVPYVYGHDLDTERDASGAATNFILDHSQPGDAIVFHIAEARVPYEFFRSLRARRNTASSKFTATLGPQIVFPHHTPGLDYRDFTGKPTADFVRAELQTHSRVWIMLMNNGTAQKPDPTTVMLSEVLPGKFPRMQRWEFARVEVRLYSKE